MLISLQIHDLNLNFTRNITVLLLKKKLSYVMFLQILFRLFIVFNVNRIFMFAFFVSVFLDLNFRSQCWISLLVKLYILIFMYILTSKLIVLLLLIYMLYKTNIQTIFSLFNTYTLIRIKMCHFKYMYTSK